MAKLQGRGKARTNQPPAISGIPAGEQEQSGEAPGAREIRHSRGDIPVTARRPKERQAFSQRFDYKENTLPTTEHAQAQRVRGRGGQPRRIGRGQGERAMAVPDMSPDLIDEIIKAHLQGVGQTAGAQPRETPDVSQLASLRGGPGPLGGLHEPSNIGGPGGGLAAMLGGGGGAGGAAGGRGMPAGMATGGQNPLAPFLAQVMNPRAAATSAQGAVPTLPGAPQGFDLWHMLQLLRMFRELYGSLPTATQGAAGLPTGIPGPGY